MSKSKQKPEFILSLEGKIRMIQMGMPVKFEHKETTYFSNHVPKSNWERMVQMEFLKEIQCVKVFSDKDEILIPLTNIRYMALWTKEHIEAEQEAIKNLNGK